MIKRIFDFTRNELDQYPDAVLMAAKENGAWRTYSVRETWSFSSRLASGLLQLGIKNETLEAEHQEKIAIISPNRPEWIITDLAVQRVGAVLTPIYPTISPKELKYIFEEAEIEKVFISGKDQWERFAEVLKSLPLLKHIYSFDKIEDLQHWTSICTEINDAALDSIDQRITTDLLATIIYTSGTTGNPKGVMLSHSNIVHNVHDSLPCFSFAIRGARALSFLPLNHIFERMVMNIYIASGVSVYFAESMETIGDNLKEVKPIVFSCVPRLLEKVYEKIVSKGLELGFPKKQMFFWALNLAKQFDYEAPQGWWYNKQLSLANKLIFSKWRTALGGNVIAIVSGASALQHKLIRIFTAAQLPVMEGYGLTETSPVISVNRYEAQGRKVGTVGLLIDNVEVRLGNDGEIITRGPNVMMGYYKNKQATDEVLTADGWLHTGDIGEWVDGKFLKITDRKKEIFKTSGGKYVAPQPIENKLRESIYIEQMMVVGAGEKFVGALIVPNLNNVRKWLEENEPNNANAAPEEIIKLKSVRQLIRGQIDRYNPEINQVEQVKKFALLAQEWTTDTGELTPSLKLKRKVVAEKYKQVIEGLYDSDDRLP